MRGKKRVTKTDQILALTAKGMKPTAIAEEVGVNPQYVWNVKSRHAKKVGQRSRKKPKAAGPNKTKGGGIQEFTRRAVAQHTAATAKEIISMLRGLGYDPAFNTVHDARAWMLRAMATLRELGMLKE